MVFLCCLVFGKVPHGAWHVVGTIRVRERRAVGSAGNTHGIGISGTCNGVVWARPAHTDEFKWVTKKELAYSAGNSAPNHLTV